MRLILNPSRFEFPSLIIGNRIGLQISPFTLPAESKTSEHNNKQSILTWNSKYSSLLYNSIVLYFHGITVVDKAYLLDCEMIEEIRFLLNYQMDSVNPMALILVGQTELRDKLKFAKYPERNCR